MDNEASVALKSYFTENDVTYQFVPPHCQRRNAAERTMRTFKDHFVAGFSLVDPDFPMHIWDRLPYIKIESAIICGSLFPRPR
jgi:hypothetical protein